MSETHDVDMLDSYDFSAGVRGKHAERYAQSRIFYRPTQMQTPDTARPSFEERARYVLSNYFGVDLVPGFVPGVLKKFDFVSYDLVSYDREIVGEGREFSLGARRPTHKLATISEQVWLLEKTRAPVTFLVFGNDRRVPELWLKDYGSLLSGMKFFFLHDDNRLELLTPLRRGRAREDSERKVPVNG